MKKVIITLSVILSLLIFTTIGYAVWVFTEISSNSNGNIIIQGYENVGTIVIKDNNTNDNRDDNFQLVLSQNEVYLNNQAQITFTPDTGVNVSDVDFKYRVIIPDTKDYYGNSYVPLDQVIYAYADTLDTTKSKNENGYIIYEGIWYPELINGNYIFTSNFSFGYKEGKEPKTKEDVEYIRKKIINSNITIEFYALKKGTTNYK